MKAEITERLSNQPLAPLKKPKSIWFDVALGVYIGGMALFITITLSGILIAGIGMSAIEKQFNTHQRR